MKIILTEIVSKVNKLININTNNNYRNQLIYRNYQVSNHDTRDYPQPYKVYKGSKGLYDFWKYLDYPNLTRPSNQSNNNRTSEYILLEIEEDYDYLEDLFTYEDKNPNIYSKKRVRIEDIEEDDDPIRFIG
jgi:hypothetical protein